MLFNCQNQFERKVLQAFKTKVSIHDYRLLCYLLSIIKIYVGGQKIYPNTYGLNVGHWTMYQLKNILLDKRFSLLSKKFCTWNFYYHKHVIGLFYASIFGLDWSAVKLLRASSIHKEVYFTDHFGWSILSFVLHKFLPKENMNAKERGIPVTN